MSEDARSGGGALRSLLGAPTPVIFVGSIILAVMVLAWQGTLGKVAAAADTLEWRQAVPAMLLYSVGLGMLAARWHALVRMAGGGASPPVSAEVFLTSVVVNYAAPIGLAVPARAALSRRDLGLTTHGSAAVVLWEALLDLGALAAVGGLWLVLGGLDAARLLAEQGKGWALSLAALLILAGLLGAAAIGFSRRVRERLRRFAGDAISLPARRPRPAMCAAALTVAFWALQLAIMSGLLASTGIAPTPLMVLGLMGWPMFIGMVSPVPGGAGVREALMVAVAGFARVDGAAVLLAALLYRMALFVSLPVIYALARLWRSRSGAAESGPTGGTV